MSDSDEDSLPNDVFTFQNNNTTISARGSNLKSNITGLSFQYNALTSTMNMPVNYERQKYCGSNFDQRSIYYGRETSPMSLRSMPDYRPTGFNRSLYQNRMATQRSMYNGRGGSPISVRSMDSTASVSAADIVFAFKNVKFNKYDLRIIKDAYNKLIKTRQRKRIEKRRNLKLFKGTRQKLGEDSGEQGSDSSVSSDDCRSVRTTLCKENIPGLRKMNVAPNFCTNIRGDINPVTNIPHLGNNMREISMFTDCTQNIKQNTLRNIMSISNSVSNGYNKERLLNTTSTQNQNTSSIKVQNTSVMTQKERFKKGFLLPSQRFNKTISGLENNSQTVSKKSGKNGINVTKPAVAESDSDQEEIFHGFSNQKEIDNIQRKRLLESEDICISNKKRNTSDSPEKTQNPNVKSNDFIFAKPKMPIKKSNTKKDHVPEKLLAKSRVPPIAEEINFNFEQDNIIPNNKETVKDIEDCESQTMLSNSDMSMRPSFIKRKLFTQKLDIAEQKNISSDSLSANSPQNIYSASMRERNKARKLVTSQSCLSREITGEDNNVLDLIHKIVPPEQINSTNLANQSDSGNNKSKNTDSSNKWDVTAVIAKCDIQDISDTYTDEEIFNVNNKKNIEESKNSAQDCKKMSQCKVVVQKFPLQTFNKHAKKDKSNSVQIIAKLADKEINKKSVTDCVKSFWDTDFESDMEFNVSSRKNNISSNIQQHEEAVHKKGKNDVGDKQSQSNKMRSIGKGTILTVKSVHHSLVNNSLKSRRSPASSKNKCIELIRSGSVVQKKENTIVDRTNKHSNSDSQTGKKVDTVKDNVAMNTKNGQPGRKPKAKQCIDYIKDTSQNVKKNISLTKDSDQSNNNKDSSKKTSKNLSVKQKDASKDSKKSDSKQVDKYAADKVISSGQKSKAKTLKEPVDVRIQPKRKSKDKSFVQSTLKTTRTKVPNKVPKTKTAKECISNNNSINSISSIITRSKDKSFNLSQGDYSSLNLSNISDRSIRLRQRVQRNIN